MAIQFHGVEKACAVNFLLHNDATLLPLSSFTTQGGDTQALTVGRSATGQSLSQRSRPPKSCQFNSQG